jgi:nitroreductase
LSGSPGRIQNGNRGCNRTEPGVRQAEQGNVQRSAIALDLFEAIEKRASVRGFTADEVGDETVSKLLAAAVRAPTAGNLQPWRFHVVRDASVKRALAEAAWGQSFVEQAPVVLVVSADIDVSARRYGSRGETLFAIQDTAAAIENILLAAVAEGLGACWVGAFSEEAASGALGLPPRVRPLALVPVGHPAGPARQNRREPFEKYTKYV